MALQIQIRRGTAAAWTAANPILAEGEMAVELDTHKYKIGDGATAWTALSYSSGTAGADGTDGEDGEDAPEVIVEYSLDGTTWSETYTEGDAYVHFSTDGGSTFGDSVFIGYGGKSVLYPMNESAAGEGIRYFTIVATALRRAPETFDRFNVLVTPLTAFDFSSGDFHVRIEYDDGVYTEYAEVTSVLPKYESGVGVVVYPSMYIPLAVEPIRPTFYEMTEEDPDTPGTRQFVITATYLQHPPQNGDMFFVSVNNELDLDTDDIYVRVAYIGGQTTDTVSCPVVYGVGLSSMGIYRYTAGYSTLDFNSANIWCTDPTNEDAESKVQDVLDALFTFANDGKTAVASAIGSTEASSTDTFSTLAGYITTDKGTLADNLTDKGVEAASSETLAALAGKVADISTGGDVSAYYMGDVHTILTAPSMPTITTSFTLDE